MSQFAIIIRTQSIQKLGANCNFRGVVNIWTFPVIFVAFPESCEELAVLLLLLSQPQPNIVQAPSDLLISQRTGSFLWISDKLVTISHTYISAKLNSNVRLRLQKDE